MSVLVVGGGVAGLAAATWLRRYDVEFRWVSRPGELGGMLTTVHNPIIDYPGVWGRDGAEVLTALQAWADEEPVEDVVERIERASNGFGVSLASGPASFLHVLLATGTRRRQLGIPGEQEGLGRWVHFSTSESSDRHRGKRLLVVGGGDAAIEGALNLVAAGAAQVTVVSRSPVHAQRQFVERFAESPSLRMWPDAATPVAFEPRDVGCQVLLDTGARLDVDAVCVRIGVEPAVPALSPFPEGDAEGFLIVDGRGETSVRGLFAAGDVTSTPLRSIATSVGDGSKAARAIAESLGIWT